MLRNILLGVGVFAALFSILIFSGKLPIGGKNTTAQGEVILWGTLPEAEVNPIIQEFNPQAKTYRVTYKEVRENVFSQTLLEALANGTGPDMILATHPILLSQISRLQPFPVTSFSEKSFKDTYVDGATLFFSPYGALALPISIEPMVLMYNRTLFAKHGLASFPVCDGKPYACWDQILTITPQLTIKNKNGQFLESAIAFGAPNTPYAKDILMSAVAQLGQTPVLVQFNQDGAIIPTVYANTAVAEDGDVLPLSTFTRFFTQFADQAKTTYTWSEFMGDASDQFVAEKLAMYIGYSGELQTLRARNPKGDFEMTYFPQTRNYNTFTTGARMYGIATLRSSKNMTASLTVQAQFASAGVSPSFAQITGGVPALRAYAGTPGLSDVVAKSMLVARGWYDSFPAQSTTLSTSMLSDIIHNRYEITDAVAIFVSRLQDLYTPR